MPATLRFQCGDRLTNNPTFRLVRQRHNRHMLTHKGTQYPLRIQTIGTDGTGRHVLLYGTTFFHP